MNITRKINFSSKVYSKSLLKVGSLKGSGLFLEFDLNDIRFMSS